MTGQENCADTASIAELGPERVVVAQGGLSLEKRVVPLDSDSPKNRNGRGYGENWGKEKG